MQSRAKTSTSDVHPAETPNPEPAPVPAPAPVKPVQSYFPPFPESTPRQEVIPPLSPTPIPEIKPKPAEAPKPTRSTHVEPAKVEEANPQDAERVKKRQNALTRTLWTFIMIGGFLTLLLMGHAYMIVLVFLCQSLVYREVTALFALTAKGKKIEQKDKDPWSKTLNWYFFAVVNYFLYGESIIYYFKHVVFSDAQLTGFATNHRFISFSLYTLGFVGFVLSLKRGYLKQQFGLFCWVHMTLLMIVVSSHFIVNNILEGMIWFWVPASLVICNDIFAYIWGVTIGRTPLIKLSPKKTVEGFLGAFISTVIFGVIWGTYFMKFQYMICPVRDLGVSAFDGGVTCTPNPVFVWRDWHIPGPLSVVLSTVFGGNITTIPYAPYQYHVFFLATFASLVAPFGGFFASGFKRAFDIKDFGHSIPGHGGMTDRMDCQFLMGMFTYVYYTSLIRQNHVTVGSVLQLVVSGLTVQEQLELIGDLKRYLEGQGISVKL
ncbi:cytidylyltransferase family-domain-containing protein [Irpex lacteus]|nr:cytidylyltransferase family-domain-containing protein [Irpex lacteus]